jgi:hypothetical protein
MGWLIQACSQLSPQLPVSHLVILRFFVFHRHASILVATNVRIRAHNTSPLSLSAIITGQYTNNSATSTRLPI